MEERSKGREEKGENERVRQQEERVKEGMNSWIINGLSRMCQECLFSSLCHGGTC